VRRAQPTATDRRFSIVPRGPGDVSVGPAGASGTNGETAGGSGTASGREPGSARPQGAGAGGAPDASLPPDTVDADLAELERWVGQRVRVGGIVTDLAADGFMLDDGTDVARIVLDGTAVEYLTLIEPEDALNVIGRVEVRGSESVVVVSDPAGIVRVGDLPTTLDGALAGPGDASAGVPAGVPVPVAPVTADAAGELGFGSGGLVGIGSLLLVSAASVAVTLVRRRRLHQVFAARVATRLNAIAAPSSGPDGVPDGRREASR
jgi:hypothetical protein